MPADTRIYLYAGGQEGEEMVDAARRMYEILQASRGAQGLTLLHIQPTAQHNEAAWRAELAPSLIWLFGLQPRQP